MHLGILKPKNTIRDGGSTALNAAYYVLFRVSQKIQKSEFWYATNPSGFHRLDEPPKKISTRLNCILQDLFRDTPFDHIARAQICIQICILGIFGQNGSRNVVYGFIMLKFFLVAHLTYENHWG